MIKAVEQGSFALNPSLDRFEIGRRLSEGQSADSAIGGKDSIPASLEAVGGEGKSGGHLAGSFIENFVTMDCPLVGEGKLASSKKTVILWASFSEKLLVESLKF